MKIEKALPILDKCIGVKFGELFSDLPSDLRINKGNVGQLLLLKIGLKLDSKLTDFAFPRFLTTQVIKAVFPIRAETFCGAIFFPSSKKGSSFTSFQHAEGKHKQTKNPWN